MVHRPHPQNHTRIAKNLNPTNPPLPTSQIFTHSNKIKSLISPPKTITNSLTFYSLSLSASLLAKLALLLSITLSLSLALRVFAWDCYLFLAVLISLFFFSLPFFEWGVRRERERVRVSRSAKKECCPNGADRCPKAVKTPSRYNVERDVTVRNPVFQSNLGLEYVGAHPKATSDSV